jgi:hypothetical protein
MRMYEPIWLKLKAMPLSEASKTGVSVTANRRLHPRIYKAVVMEKYKDLPYKLSMDPLKTILWHKSRGSILTFYLFVSEKTITSESV